MASYNLSKLLAKYADERGITSFLNDNARFQYQRRHLAEFSRQFKSRLQIILAEMEGELFTLKEKKFDRSAWRELGKLWNHLGNIARQFNEEKPYLAASELVEFVHSRPTLIAMENIQFLANHHLEKTKESLPNIPGFQHPQIRSLKLLKSLAEHADVYMEQNPLMPIPVPTPTPSLVPEPQMLAPVGPEQPTRIEMPIPQKQVV